MRLLLKNGTVVNEGSCFKGSLLIEDEFIKEIIPENSFREFSQDTEVIDVTGLYILPGVIDCHVHFRQPGDGRKGTIESESRAVVLGGVTSFMDMPNTLPPTTSKKLLKEKFNIAKDSSYANYSFYLGASKDNIEEIKSVDRKNVCGVKLFMGASTGNMMVDDEKALEDIFKFSPIPVAVHCEDNSIIARNLREYKDKYGDDIPTSCHPLIRSREACLNSTKKAVALAEKYNAQLHVLHVTTKEEAELFSKMDNPKITGECCANYLWFCSDDYGRFGNLIKANPAIKDREDMTALREAVKRGVLKTVGSDHAPHLLEDKKLNYLNAPSGIPNGEYTLLIMLTLAKEGFFTLNDVAQRLSHSPADIYKVEKRGYIKEGYFADLAIVNLNRPFKDIAAPASKAGWSPFTEPFPASVEYTFVNGCMTVKNGELTGERKPLPLTFNR